MIQVNDEQYFMHEALKEAGKALEADEVPIGAVVVSRGYIIARGHNMVERLQDTSAHAEMIALTAASNSLGSKYLPECTLYVTLEPCPMCAAAMGWAQLGALVYGASDTKRGYTTINGLLLHPGTQVSSGILAVEASTLMKEFFRQKRDRTD